tara:strand:- start:528 stop:791 length:264 start_codon:yes stop_codon:yes gene_type:complete
MANDIGFGKIYETTWFGNPVKNGWGGIYFDLPFNVITLLFQSRVIADGGIVESLSCVNNITNNFVIDYLLKDDNGFLLQENGYKIIL